MSAPEDFWDVFERVQFLQKNIFQLCLLLLSSFAAASFRHGNQKHVAFIGCEVVAALRVIKQ